MFNGLQWHVYVVDAEGELLLLLLGVLRPWWQALYGGSSEHIRIALAVSVLHSPDKLPHPLLASCLTWLHV